MGGKKWGLKKFVKVTPQPIPIQSHGTIVYVRFGWQFFYGKFVGKYAIFPWMASWNISGKLLRSHDLWHGRGGGVMIGHRWSVGCFRWLRIGPTRNNERTTNNQPPATLTKIFAHMFSFTCLFEWCFLLKPCFLSGSPLLPLLLFGCFFFRRFAGFTSLLFGSLSFVGSKDYCGSMAEKVGPETLVWKLWKLWKLVVFWWLMWPFEEWKLYPN